MVFETKFFHDQKYRCVVQNEQLGVLFHQILNMEDKVQLDFFIELLRYFLNSAFSLEEYSARNFLSNMLQIVGTLTLNNLEKYCLGRFLDHIIPVKTWDGLHTIMVEMKRKMEN